MSASFAGEGAEGEDYTGGGEHGECENSETALVAAGEVASPAHEGWSENSADYADHVDGRQAGGCSLAVKESTGEGQERALNGVVGEVHDGEDGNGTPRIEGEGYDGKTAGLKNAGEDDVPVWAAVAVGEHSVDDHTDGSQQAHGGDDVSDDGVAEMGEILDNRGKREGVGVQSAKHEEIGEAIEPDARVLER